MEGFAENFIQLELKYCERCGGLWLRPGGSDLVFCGRCARNLAVADAGLVNRRHSFVAPQDAPSAQFWSEGGNA